MLGAVRRWLRGDYRSSAAESPWLLKVITWGLLGLITAATWIGAVFREAAAGGARRRLRSGRRAVAAAAAGASAYFRTICDPRRYVEKADIVRYGPHPRVNFADIWRRRDLPRDGKAPVLLQVPGGAWSIGMRRPQAYPPAEPHGRTRAGCVSIDYRVSPPPHLARPHRRRQARAGLDQGAHRRVRRRPRLRRDHRWLGGRAPLCIGRPDARRSAVPARFRGCRHVRGRGPIYGRYDWFPPGGRDAGSSF